MTQKKLYLVHDNYIIVYNVVRETATRWVVGDEKRQEYINKSSKCYFTDLKDAEKTLYKMLERKINRYKKQIDGLSEKLLGYSSCFDRLQEGLDGGEEEFLKFMKAAKLCHKGCVSGRVRKPKERKQNNE